MRSWESAARSQVAAGTDSHGRMDHRGETDYRPFVTKTLIPECQKGWPDAASGPTAPCRNADLDSLGHERDARRRGRLLPYPGHLVPGMRRRRHRAAAFVLDETLLSPSDGRPLCSGRAERRRALSFRAWFRTSGAAPRSLIQDMISAGRVPTGAGGITGRGASRAGGHGGVPAGSNGWPAPTDQSPPRRSTPATHRASLWRRCRWLGFAADRLMALEVQGPVRGGHGQRSPMRPRPSGFSLGAIRPAACLSSGQAHRRRGHCPTGSPAKRRARVDAISQLG
jgi:hypothetical protein